MICPESGMFGGYSAVAGNHRYQTREKIWIDSVVENGDMAK
jgi:hypothetical protein